MNIKRFIAVFAVLIVMVFIVVSCTNTKKDDAKNTGIQVQDTLGLSEYQKWKMQNELSNPSAVPPQATASTKSSSSSSKSASKSSTSRRTTYKSSGNTYSSSSGSSGSQSGTSNNTAATQPAATQRKGMSHTAKGAIVGAASGAIIGAVANKKDRLGGGVVGGVIGAATGAGIGSVVDKKERNGN